MRPLLAALTVTSGLVLGAVPAGACDLLLGCTDDRNAEASRPPSTKGWLTGAINDARAQEGLSPVKRDRSLDQLADEHAARMAKDARIYHNEEGLRARRARTGETLGENVGVGDDLPDVHRAFLASPSHRNTMFGRYKRLGIGLAKRGGEIYVVEVFARDGSPHQAPPPQTKAAPKKPAPVAAVADGSPVHIGHQGPSTADQLASSGATSRARPAFLWLAVPLGLLLAAGGLFRPRVTR